MITVAAGVKVLVATKPVDFRKGADGLVALVRGRRSERLDHDQMQLALEDIETTIAEQDAQEDNKETAQTPADAQSKKRRANRGSLPAHLPRIHVTLAPESLACPCCHGAMHVIGEDTADRLDVIPAQYQVIVTHRSDVTAVTAI